MNAFPLEITPLEVKDLIERGAPVRLIDVREPAEHDICRIEGARLIPMRSIPQHLDELDDADSAIVVFCHHGVRSLSVVDWLRRQASRIAGAWPAGSISGACRWIRPCPVLAQRRY